MSERGTFRGGGPSGRGAGRGRGGQDGRGGSSGRGGGRGGGAGGAQERPKKENILDLGRYIDKEIMVKFNGGREGECAEERVSEWKHEACVLVWGVGASGVVVLRLLCVCV